MRRRQYLAVGTVLAGSVAGCSGVQGETPLAADEPIVDDSSAVLPFTADGEDVFKVQLQKQFTGDEPRTYYPFFIASWQRDGVSIDSFRLSFRSPPATAAFVPAGIALREGGHADRATLSRDGEDPSETVVELPDTTDIGGGSVRVDLLLERDDRQVPQELRIGAVAGLSADGLFGSDYRASGELTVEFP